MFRVKTRIPLVDYVFDKDNPQESSLELAHHLFPKYEQLDKADLEVKVLTKGTTNCVSFMVLQLNFRMPC